MADWLVRVYNSRNTKVAEWKIENRTEREAESEAQADVDNMNQYKDGWDWSMTEIKKR